MAKNKQDAESTQARWARFRFSIIGPLLAAPPDEGGLKNALLELTKKQWQHPITGVPVHFSFSTLERWFYAAKRSHDPIETLRVKRRSDCAQSRKLSTVIKKTIKNQNAKLNQDVGPQSYALHASLVFLPQVAHRLYHVILQCASS